MTPDYCFIAAAGHGTRMGEIGKVLPKPLWPVFELRMIEFPILKARELGIKNITINTHHHSEKISKFINEKYPDITILHEDVLLGSGGGIHNFARQPNINYQGNVLVLNADLLYEFDYNKFFKTLEDPTVSTSLALYEIKDNQTYHRLEIKKDNFISVGDKSTSGFTFSGISLIRLEKLKPVNGNSEYFKSVVSSDGVNKVFNPGESTEYYDWGTLKNYIETNLKLIQKLKSPLGCLDLNLLNKQKESYHSDQYKVLNFTGKNLVEKYTNSIIIEEHESPNSLTFNKPSVISRQLQCHP